MKSIVRSNSAAASADVLQISHIKVFTISALFSFNPKTHFCRHAMRADGDICGHSPCPPFHACSALTTAISDSLTVKRAIVPMTVRWPVFSSIIGLLTSSYFSHGNTSPLMNIFLPASINGFLDYSLSDCITFIGSFLEHD